ncbi:ABC transporter permease [Subtercola endophyticus]|uniref:ABC transporter permease n=1 Tax=Subtercola endophyticus TaxID=2895559 RepID=UPI001E2F01F5|nr:ABC transporter permease [Subtercola endophyticus]UFS58738.1 ABC transporter permease [Subtercola endophyticus]
MTLTPSAPRHDKVDLDPVDESFAEAVTPPKSSPKWVTIASGLILPLFFIVMFTICYVSAFHAPHPVNAPLIIVGQQAQTSAIEDGILQQSGDAFTITTTASVTEAVDSIMNRDAIGAIEIGPTVTIHIASGAGGVQTATVERVGQQIAQQLGTTATIDDLAPLSSNDSTGTALFYLFIICTIGGYLTMTVFYQVAPKMKLRNRYTLLGATAVAVPAIVFGLSSIFVGSYGVGFGAIAAVLAIAAVYTFTVGAITIVANQLLGQAAIFLVMTLVIFLNFPSSGGAIPQYFLPGFWQGVHSFWVGSAAMEPIRSIIYFGGANVWPWLSHLGIWLLITLGFSAVLGVRKATAERTAEALPTSAESATSEEHRHAEVVGAGS